MSAAQTPSRGGLGPVVMGVFVVALLVLLVFLGGKERPLQRAATGFDGLVAWLKANDVEARAFAGGAPLVKGEIGLRILPLYDTDLTQKREVPDTREAVIAETSETDLPLGVLRRKVNAIPTLVILPKWRTGMRKLGVAHKDLLIPEQEMNRLLGQLGLDGARVRRDPEGYNEWDMSIGDNGQRIGLMHGQTIRDSGCEPVIGSASAPVLVHCAPIDAAGNQSSSIVGGDKTFRNRGPADQGFWLLADPDLLNNHGLPLAENGLAGLRIIEGFDPDLPVILDLTTRYNTVSEDWMAERYERSWDDFARMFVWPFTMIWIAFACVGALVLWRAVTRYGPVARPVEDEPRAAKITSIEAKARLLRLANHDEALLKSHISARLNQLAAEILGPHRPTGRDPLDVLVPLVRRTNPQLADALKVAAADFPGDILHRLDQFETCYDRIRNEFGRPANAG